MLYKATTCSSQQLKSPCDFDGSSYHPHCQYIRNLKPRILADFKDDSLLERVIEILDGVVPKMHGEGNQDDCRYRYSFDSTVV